MTVRRNSDPAPVDAATGDPAHVGSLHVAYVLKRFPRISETFVAAEIAELERRGHRVTVFATARPDEPFTHALVDELRARVVYLPHRPSRQPVRTARALARVVVRAPRGLVRAASTLIAGEHRPWPTTARLRRLLQACVLVDELERAEVDHVHAHFATAATRLANLAWRMTGRGYSVTTHAKDIYHVENDPVRLRAKLDEACFVATVCDANRAHLRRRVGVRAPVHVVPNSIDARRLPAPSERRAEPHTVLAVARLVEKKGLVDLVRAGGILRDRGLEVRIELVGDGPLRPALHHLAATVCARVTFRGAVPHEEVVDRYRRASVFALPCVVTDDGDRDGLPTAVLEAMAAGVPVVATAVTGLGELLVDGRNGLVVDQHDPAGLADALQRMLTDDALAARLSRAGRETVLERHDLRRTVALLERLFAEAAA